MEIRTLYLTMAVIGTVIPWSLFAWFFAAHGADVTGFVVALAANGAVAGFTADILLSILVFWLWSYRDARLRDVERWWLVLPATFIVGLSLALPLYLYLREGEAGPRSPAWRD